MNDPSSSVATKKSPIQHLISFLYRNAPIIIIVLGILMRVPFLFTPDAHGFQHDSWRQTDTASIAYNFVTKNFNILYPQINWGGNEPGYVEAEFQLYPYLVALLNQAFGTQLWLGALVSLLFTSATFVVFYKFAREFFQGLVVLIALVIFELTPVNVSYSTVFMPEPTVLFFYISGIYLFYKWIKHENIYWLIFGAISTALAVLVKPTSIHIGFLFLFLLLEKYRLKLFTKWQVWLFVVISLLPGIGWYLHARNIFIEYGNTFGIISGGDSKFNNLQYWFSPDFYRGLFRIYQNWVFAGGIIAFALGIIIFWQKQFPKVILYGIGSILIYFFLIPRYVSFAEYYHIYSLPFTSITMAFGIVWFFDREPMPNKNPKLRSWIFYFLGAITIFSFLYTSLRHYRYALISTEQPLWICAQSVASIVSEDSLVIVNTYSPSIQDGIPNNYQQPDIFYYSHRYGWSLPSDHNSIEYVEKYRDFGAEFFIVVDNASLLANEELVEWLRTNAEQIGPGMDEECSIYRFDNIDSG